MWFQINLKSITNEINVSSDQKNMRDLYTLRSLGQYM